MSIISTRMTSVLLVFGIFFTLSCATFQSTTTKSAEEYFAEKNYSQALTAINNELSEQPDATDKRVLKAKILKEFAKEDHEPQNRAQVYENFRNTVDEVNFSTDQYNSVTNELLNSAWSHEQGEGVRLLQQDETNNFDRHFDRIIAHFNNAITIIPDSLVTYNLKATTYYRHGDLAKAIATLESIGENGFSNTPAIREKLAYLYLESGLVNSSIDMYVQLRNEYPENQLYLQGLANAYILGEMHEESVELLKALTEEFPNRAEYGEALATETFYLLLDDTSALLNNNEFTGEDIEKLITELNEIGQKYDDAERALPSSDERQDRIAQFHLNAAALLANISETQSSDSELKEQVISERKNHLKRAIPFLRSLFETNSDNLAYARKLIRVYNSLGMTNEAETLERQINL